jgi:hypothetical protein
VLQAVSTSPNLTVTAVTEDTQGKYVCQAVVQGFPQVSALATVSLKGPPKIESQKVQYGVEGDSVKLECRVRSIPKPERITWTHLGREIDNRKFLSSYPSFTPRFTSRIIACIKIIRLVECEKP